MNVYEVKHKGIYTGSDYVIAESFAEAEQIINEYYNIAKPNINNITLFGTKVLMKQSEVTLNEKEINSIVLNEGKSL